MKNDYGMTDEEFREFRDRMDAERQEKEAAESKIERRLERRRQKKELKQGVKDSCKTQ